MSTHMSLVTAMKAGGVDGPKATVGSYQDARNLIVPVHELLAKKPSPQFRHDVERVRPMRDIVQRDMEGKKLTNAKRDIPEYVRRHIDDNGQWTGPVWDVVIWMQDALVPVGEPSGPIGQYQINPTRLGFCLDAESRMFGLEEEFINADSDEYRLAVLNVPLTLKIYDGIPLERAAQHFRDTNGLGVGINAAVLLGHDYEDPYMGVTNNVFGSLGIPLEGQKRQVSERSSAVMTVVQARTMVAAIAHGIGAVGFGAGRIPDKVDGIEVDFDKLRDAATTWLKEVFTQIPPSSFKDKNMVLGAAPVIASLGAAGKAFYTGNLDDQLRARAMLSSGIDWFRGQKWVGIAGKINPQGSFSVSSGKESGHATFRAITDPSDPGYAKIR